MMTRPNFARRSLHAVLVATALLAAPSTGAAQSAPASERGNRLAYDHSIRCFIANLYLAGEAQERGDPAQAERSERQGQRAFDGAKRLGAIIGKTNAQMTADFDAAEARELPKLVRDSAYRSTVNGVCQRLGLM
jgi:gas vesicle protein